MTVQDSNNSEKSAIIRGLQLLELMLEHSEAMSIRELAEGFGSQPSTVHRTLAIFENNGYLLRDISGRLNVGAKLLRLALLIVDQADPDGLLHEELAKVVQQTNETCVLFLVKYPVSSEVFVADIVNSPHPLQYQLPLGHSHAITAGASGLAGLAFMPRAVQDALLGRPLKRYTKITTMDPDALRRKLDTIRELGYAITYGECISGAVGIAMPVFDQSEAESQVLGDICLTIPSERFDERQLNHYVNVLREAADSYSRNFTAMRKYGHQLKK